MKIIFLILNGVLILFLFLRRKKMEKESLPFLFSLILYFILELISRICYYFFNRVTEFSTNTDMPFYEAWSVVILFGLLFSMLGPVYLIFLIEKTFFKNRILKEKHLVTILQLIIIVLLFILNLINIGILYSETPNSHWIENLNSPITTLFLGVLFLQFSIFFAGFLYLGIKSSGSFKKYSLYVSNGFFLRGVMNLLSLIAVDNLLSGKYFFSADFFYIHMGILDVLQVLGLIVMFYGLLKLYSLEDIKIESDEMHEVIKQFIRPKKLTEEEVTFYKEQKICMVCKGKAIGFNIFVCPKCDALYCKNCAEQLSTLENACWACNNPFDPSKPSTPFQKEKGDQIKKEIEIHKKKKL